MEKEGGKVNGDFIIIDKSLRHLNLSLSEQVILSAIISFKIYYGGYEFVNQIVNMSRATYWRSIKALLSKNLITQLDFESGKTKKSRYKSNLVLVSQNDTHNILNYASQNETHNNDSLKMRQPQSQNETPNSLKMRQPQSQNETHNIIKPNSNLKVKEESVAHADTHAHTLENLFNNFEIKEINNNNLLDSYVNFINSRNTIYNEIQLKSLKDNFIEASKKYNHNDLIMLIKNEMIPSNHITIYYDRLDKKSLDFSAKKKKSNEPDWLADYIKNF